MTINREPASIIVSFLQSLASVLRERQFEPEEIFFKHGIKISDTLDSRICVDENKINSLLTDAEKLLDDPSLGINMAKKTDYSVFGAVGIAIASGDSVLSILERMQRYHQLLESTIQFEIDVIGDRVRVSSFQIKGKLPHSQGVQYLMANIVRIMRIRLSGSINPLDVHVVRDDKEYLKKISRYFRVVPKIEQDYAVFFDRGLMSKKLHSSESTLDAAVKNIRNSRLEDKAKVGFITQLTLWIENHLPEGEPSIEDVAKEFHLTSGSLQNRLNEEGVTWQELIMSVRISKMEQYVKMPDISVTQLAFLLGFSTVTKFSEAFME